jgi:hypothetical protein
MNEISRYYDADAITRAVAEGRHRDVIGGLWDEMGELQLDFLRANGLSALRSAGPASNGGFLLEPMTRTPESSCRSC